MQPPAFDLIQFIGAACIGFMIGWFVYHINRDRKPNPQLDDLTTLIAILGMGVVTLYNNPYIFAGYGVGLLIGFASYSLAFLAVVVWSGNFASDWLMDARRKRAPEPQNIPDTAPADVEPDAAPLQKLPRSYRQRPNLPAVGDVDDSKPVTLSVVMKPGVPFGKTVGRSVTREQFRARHRTSQAVINRLVRFAIQHGLQVEEIDAEHHTVRLSGSYLQARRAFAPEHLAVYRDGDKEYVARGGHISVPKDLVDDVVGVVGFDLRPVAKPHIRMADNNAGTSYEPGEVAAVYKFPKGDGTGQTIALIALGGGYDRGLLAKYFSDKGIRRTGSLEDISVLGSVNASDGQPLGGDGELQMGLEIVGSLAPAANILVYFAPGNANGLLEAARKAIGDNRADVISITWGWPEAGSAEQDIDIFNQLFETARTHATICVASGDLGAVDGSATGEPTADFPAGSPFVLTCGGTTLPRGDDEKAWRGSGGGYSKFSALARPDYQDGVHYNSGRGEPDVAANADVTTGYRIRVNSNDVVLGGTSAAAPLWAALIALINQKLGTNVAFVNPALYRAAQQNGAGLFNDIETGTNDGYAATRGWDPVTGWGSPIGTKVLAALKSAVNAPPLVS